MSKQKEWEMTLVDCDDGNGDCYLEFPPDVLTHLRWQAGDVIDFQVVDNCFYMRKLDELS
ncbi:hypothetical protein [Undibacterium danionis]|uniref:Uncharacterized protein n=1 Tax=Undibacterium danionis TaxID=1812100 RepID=A0ABV6IDG2_9BURK